MSERRLDTVLRIRRLQEQLASAEVARSRQTADAAAAQEHDAWRHVAERATTSARTADQLLVERQMLAGGMAHARRLGDLTAAARHHVDLALDDWRTASRRLDGIERLSERIDAARRNEEERKQHTELDDLVVMRWDGAAA
jgi:flagellar export protein FliJ